MDQMQNENRKFLEFNGKHKNVLSKNGQSYVAIKPICQSLGLDYGVELESIKNDEILKNEIAELEIFKNAKIVKYQCLPEKFIYGWIFSLDSESEDFKQYKAEANSVLTNNFKK